MLHPDVERVPPVEELPRYEAARLFVERARAATSTFELKRENAPMVTRLCRMLDGVPLAIELAAARTKVLSVEQILKRLDDSLKLLTGTDRTAPERQRTLRGTLDWSYDLLGEQERKLFGRLSVFASGWTLEAAEVVGAGDDVEEDVLDLLFGLVDKSLVVAEAETEDARRYRMLEPVRQYARERLGEDTEAERVFRRHADFFLQLAEGADPELKGPRQAAWVERLTGEHDNLRTAMRWLLKEGESEAVAKLGWALWLFWWIRGHFTEGRG